MYAKLIFARITNDISCRSAAKYYMYTGINGPSHLEYMYASLIILLNMGEGGGGGTYIIIRYMLLWIYMAVG